MHINLTEGSRNAIKPVSPLINARINDIRAAAISIFTSKSSNCFKTNFQNGAPAFQNLQELISYNKNQLSMRFVTHGTKHFTVQQMQQNEQDQEL